MTDAAISATTLKTIRKARKLGRPRLARMSGLSERQISKLEASAAGTHAVKTDAIARLATALGVPEAVLTGDMAVSETDLTPMAETKCTTGCCG